MVPRSALSNVLLHPDGTSDKDTVSTAQFPFVSVCPQRNRKQEHSERPISITKCGHAKSGFMSAHGRRSCVERAWETFGHIRDAYGMDVQ